MNILSIKLSFLLIILLSSCENVHDSSQENLYIDSLTSNLLRVAESSPIPGYCVILVNDEKISYSHGFGFSDLNKQIPFTDSTINVIASVSKTFVGLSLMILVDEGKLNLDEPINDILPYNIVNPNFPDSAITVRHLATHTSSFDQEFDPEDVGEAMVYLIEKTPNSGQQIPEYVSEILSFYELGKPISLDEHIRNYLTPKGKWFSQENFYKNPPGDKYEYDNLNAAVAARIIEIKSGISFDKFTKQRIFEPLEMNNTFWHYPKRDSKIISKLYVNHRSDSKPYEFPRYEATDYPGGGLKTTARDLSVYLIEMIKGYNGKGQLISKMSYQTLFEPQLHENQFEERSQASLDQHYNSGIFWGISASGNRLHLGGSTGVYSFLYFNPATSSGAISFSNLADNSFGKVRDEVLKYEPLINKISEK